MEVSNLDPNWNCQAMWNWKHLFAQKIEVSPLIEQNLKGFCSDDVNHEEHKFRSDNLVRKWLRDCSDDLTGVSNTNIARDEIASSATSIPFTDQNIVDHRDLKLEHHQSISKNDFTEDLSRLSRTGTDERTPAAPDGPPKELMEKKISCFSFVRRK